MKLNKDEFIWTKMTKVRKTERRNDKKTEREIEGMTKRQNDRKTESQCRENSVWTESFPGRGFPQFLMMFPNYVYGISSWLSVLQARLIANLFITIHANEALHTLEHAQVEIGLGTCNIWSKHILVWTVWTGDNMKFWANPQFQINFKLYQT